MHHNDHISGHHHWFAREMTSDERVQKFHTDHVSLRKGRPVSQKARRKTFRARGQILKSNPIE